MRVSAPLGAGLRVFVRIRIRGIIGFSGFLRRAFATDKRGLGEAKS